MPRGIISSNEPKPPVIVTARAVAAEPGCTLELKHSSPTELCFNCGATTPLHLDPMCIGQHFAFLYLALKLALAA